MHEAVNRHPRPNLRSRSGLGLGWAAFALHESLPDPRLESLSNRLSKMQARRGLD